MENSLSKVQRLQAERENCIRQASDYQTRFPDSIRLFQRAEALQIEIDEEVKSNVLSVQPHHTTNLP
ncbi:hypothetical protein [Caproicibacterium amylolyticum]|uniref:Uncharacterized protein n=1 Tax=Caproicibacterium amylolyticum TaxID=2766537 RepID=A0A7G9WJH3_9FIRM|nr:hypothetical protein [Caproicibacterium amylolyticum]QNO18835.1 hypothetical protein H6X83_04150 [Caproicibacterium amylolyticum]